LKDLKYEKNVFKRNIREYGEKGRRLMNKCPDCNKFGACEKASEDVIECLDFKKQSYNTKLVKVDRLNYKFEEVK
jgi:hypothetical protein